ncbi:MAG: DUF3710 domain-containing protein [Bifidobacteriaceae bacterium]|jgi:hypothetical protein|nr:DUF3710 domain-containing protein [Bifidobacteriaceae bacterium]
MGLFSKRHSKDNPAEPAEDTAANGDVATPAGDTPSDGDETGEQADIGDDAEETDAGEIDEDAPAEPLPPRDDLADGPFDASDVDGIGDRIDLGSLWVPAGPELTIRMEIERATGRPVSVGISRDGSTLQVQVFAAPKTTGIWDDVRADLKTAITSKKGTVEEAMGPFGVELHAKIPARTSDGRQGKRLMRFIGVDGPRWFVRGTLTGKGVRHAEAAAPLERVFADIVVKREDRAQPPGELLTLTAPGLDLGPKEEAEERPKTKLRLPKRGPEITEVR